MRGNTGLDEAHFRILDLKKARKCSLDRASPIANSMRLNAGELDEKKADDFIKPRVKHAWTRSFAHKIVCKLE